MVPSNSRNSTSSFAQMRSKKLKGHCLGFPAEFAMLLILLPLVGCGGNGEDVRPVTGRVTLDEQSLPNAKVDFFPVAEGSSASAFTDENGEYELEFAGDQKGAPLGKYTVSISKVKDSPEGDVEVLPRIYNEETTLAEEVTADGDNVFDFNLKSE